MWNPEGHSHNRRGSTVGLAVAQLLTCVFPGGLRTRDGGEGLEDLTGGK